MYLPLVTWLTGIPRRARGCPALHPWRDPCRRVSGDGMRVEPSLMHPEGGSWTEVRTHTPSKFSKVLHEPLAPIPLERSKFRENGSQPPPNRAEPFPCYTALQWARFAASGPRVSHPLPRLSSSTCGPSPCGWLSQPATTTTTL